MEVLYITKTSLLSDGGGGEERARQVTSGLASRGHNVTVLCGKTDRELQRWMVNGSCEFRHVNCIPSFLFRFSTLSFYATRYLFALVSPPVLLWVASRNDFDVLVENMTPYPSLSIVVAKLTRTPIVAVQHEFYDRSCYQTYDPVTATIQLLVQNILHFGNYAAVIVPTTHVADQLADYGVDASRIVVVLNGVNAEKYHLSDVDRDRTSLLTIERLSKRKGQDTILRAFQHVHEQAPETHLHILGKGPAREDLEELSRRLDISDAMTFHGYVDTDRKVRLMNESALFVFVSRQEGFGLVLLEAMAAGLPVVATKLPVYEDFFTNEKHGRLVLEQNPQKLANSIADLLQNKEEMKNIRSANVQTAQNFSWQTTIEHIEEVLHRMADNREPIAVNTTT